ncbi:AAA family ATPase [Candidatus Sumerlaeota bacterium]
MRILNALGVFGWKEQDERLVMASLLTGDPLLLIGNHGSAKTLIANKVAEALGLKSLVYDASKAMFEDVLGYPNVEKLKEGIVEYVPSKVTVWDKELILIDELNRAIPELQSKWLEIIRSRKIMGFETDVKWVWSAMNPMSYSATQALDEALVGRFALFLYPPDVLQMSEEDRIKVTMHINGEDAPGLAEWLPGPNGKTIDHTQVEETGRQMCDLLKRAAVHFVRLKEQMTTLSEFLAKFADLLMRETNGEITLDGRRLGFIYRNILAARSVELAKAEALNVETGSFVESARYVVQSSIPIGLNDESVKREEALHKMDICFELLSAYFDENSEIALVNKVYELFTTPDLMRRAEILLHDGLNDFAKSKAWNDLVKEDRDITLLAYTALQVEARRPGSVPKELLESLSGEIENCQLSTICIPDLHDEAIEYIEEVEALLEQDSDLAKLVAYNHVQRLADQPVITPNDIKETERLIQQDMLAFEHLLGGGDDEDLQVVA